MRKILSPQRVFRTLSLEIPVDLWKVFPSLKNASIAAFPLLVQDFQIFEISGLRFESSPKGSVGYSHL